ncbi:morphogenic membrane protein MmpA [Streptomyces sp.]
MNGTDEMRAGTQDGIRIDRAVAAGLAVAGAVGVAWLAGMVYVITAWSMAG